MFPARGPLNGITQMIAIDCNIKFDLFADHMCFARPSLESAHIKSNMNVCILLKGFSKQNNNLILIKKAVHSIEKPTLKIWSAETKFLDKLRFNTNFSNTHFSTKCSLIKAKMVEKIV